MSAPLRPLGEALLEKVLACYPIIKRGTCSALEPLRSGLIHQSFRLQSGAREYLLQRVNPIFGAGVHENVRRVTEWLACKGLETPRLVATAEGLASADLGAEGRFRMMRFVPGQTFETCTSPAQARAAGGLVARFHSALADFDAPLAPLGFSLHDTAQHLADLEAALRARQDHPLYAQVAPLAREILEDAARWDVQEGMPMRLVHADLKFNNVLFAPATGAPDDVPRACCLIDLDTLCRLPLWVELGDAWRSWCNRQGEDSAEAQLDLGLFEAAARGYLDALEMELLPRERRALAQGIERVALELAARFATDALEERYFAWDPARFGSAGEHNLLRARGQLSLSRQARDARDVQARILA